jgi:hypothetical protein
MNIGEMGEREHGRRSYLLQQTMIPQIVIAGLPGQSVTIDLGLFVRGLLRAIAYQQPIV